MEIRIETISPKRERMKIRETKTIRRKRRKREREKMIGEGRKRRIEETVKRKEITGRSSKEGRGMSQETKRNNTDPSMKMNVVLRSATRRGGHIVEITKMTGMIGKENITETAPKSPDTATERKNRTEGSTESTGTTHPKGTTGMAEKTGIEIILKIGAISAKKRRIDPEEMSRAEVQVG